MENPVEYTYQDDVIEELIDGVWVAMSPRPIINHHVVAQNIYIIFHNYFKGKKCRPFGDGVDVYLSEKDRFVPDGMVVCDQDKIKGDGIHGAPDLVVEVLSPSTSRRDKGYKRQVYARHGVREYWLVNPADKSVEVYLPENGRLEFHDSYTVLPDYDVSRMTSEQLEAVPKAFQCSLFDDLVIRLDDVFERVE